MLNHSLLLDDLNNKQCQAVSAPLSNLLVLAGAGSGKTRVLVHRIAWILSQGFSSAFSILAVTFTNKAATEMKSRIDELMTSGTQGMWVGTFHGICYRMLRAHYMSANLPENFQIIDSDDQLRLIKRLLKAQNLDEKQWPAKQIAWWINTQKDDGLRPWHIEPYYDQNLKIYLQLYTAYQEVCDRSGLIDFAEIILRVHELLREHKHIREHYQARFGHILIDEFQDTNNIQYAWLRLIAGDKAHVMIVGDDDQSIYGWRGAQIENIKKFTQDFTNVTTIRLEQNYRSTKNILDASNALIANNTNRIGKQLWTDGMQGEPISIYCAYQEVDEAKFVVNKIQNWQEAGGTLSSCAILYRNNAQSRNFEDILIQEGLAYRIYGGMRFFERQEIKDAVGYLRLIANRDDDAAFERIINTPARSIGNKTIDTIRSAARDQKVTLWQASKSLVANKLLSARALNALGSFISLINKLEDDTKNFALFAQTDHVIKHSGLYDMYTADKSDKSQSKIDNLQELVTATEQFTIPSEMQDMSPLMAFIVHASLESGDAQAKGVTDAVQMMTLHTAKGLEFPLVFIVGVEEGMFPSQMSAESSDRLEEERRLCYVGMTRAMKKLYITHAEKRRLYGKEHYHMPSRFINELPVKYVDEIRVKPTIKYFNNIQSSEIKQVTLKKEIQDLGLGFNLGDRVKHKIFGEGTIVNLEANGAHSKVQIAFYDGTGIKWLMLSHAPLEKL